MPTREARRGNLQSWIVRVWSRSGTAQATCLRIWPKVEPSRDGESERYVPRQRLRRALILRGEFRGE